MHDIHHINLSCDLKRSALASEREFLAAPEGIVDAEGDGGEGSAEEEDC